MSTTKEALKLNVMVGDYPNTVALIQGKVRSDRLQLNFAEAKVPHDHFKRVVKGEFDVAELAIMTYLQAIGYGRPLVALPVVLHGRFQHAQIAYNADRGTLTPADLHGKRVGVRTYPQTTPTWVRGILQNDYGVDLSKYPFHHLRRWPRTRYPRPAQLPALDLRKEAAADAARRRHRCRGALR